MASSTCTSTCTTNASFSSLVCHPVLIGLLIRFVVAWLLPALMDESSVPYTDVDYHVFQDAAAYVLQGGAVSANDIDESSGGGDSYGSPYQRTTYRYTPFLAALIASLPARNITARFLFCLADTLCGWILYATRQQARQQNQTQKQQQQQPSTTPTSFSWLSPKTIDAAVWLYNPLAINICTRGSAEALVVLLPVLITMYTCQLQQGQRLGPFLRASLTGMAHGVAMHCKVYPVIYSAALATTFQQTTTATTRSSNNNGKQQSRRRQQQSFVQWLLGFMAHAPLWFGVVAITTWACLTAAAVYYYGKEAWTEGFIYHAARIDHRHNYSMHWLPIYLMRGGSSSTSTSTTSSTMLPTTLGHILLLPQVIWILTTSWKLARHDLQLCLFVQTLAFVAQNKVITAQYFTWYGILWPATIRSTAIFPIMRAAVWLVVAMLLWLATAYLLEMQGWAVHGLVWMASVHFFVAHVHFLCAVLVEIPPRQQQQPGKRDDNDKAKTE